MRQHALLLALAAFTMVATACSEAPEAGSRMEDATVATEAATEAIPAAGLTPIALRVPDMSCRLCAKPIEHALREMGVRDVKADLDTKWVTGRFDPERVAPETIRARVEELRFRVSEVQVG